MESNDAGPDPALSARWNTSASDIFRHGWMLYDNVTITLTDNVLCWITEGTKVALVSLKTWLILTSDLMHQTLRQVVDRKFAKTIPLFFNDSA